MWRRGSYRPKPPGLDTDPATHLGRERDLGEIEVGKIADVVMLDGNPLTDIRNVGKISAIVKSGVLREDGLTPLRVGRAGRS